MKRKILLPVIVLFLMLGVSCKKEEKVTQKEFVMKTKPLSLAVIKEIGQKMGMISKQGRIAGMIWEFTDYMYGDN